MGWPRNGFCHSHGRQPSHVRERDLLQRPVMREVERCSRVVGMIPRQSARTLVPSGLAD